MPLRVLLHAHVNPADEGGVQSVVRRLAGDLRSQGHAVRSTWGLGAPEGTGHVVTALPPLIFRGALPAPRSAVQALGALVRLSVTLLRDRPHVVNVHYVTGEAIYFVLLKRIVRCKVVLSFHGSDILRPQAPDVPLLPRILAGADAMTVVSETAAARLRERASVKSARVRVIPNGIDHQFWSAASSPSNGGGCSPVVLSVGRLDPVKGHDVLLRAFPRVLARVPGARLVIAGDGGYRGALERIAEDAGVTRAVEFAGPLDAEGVRSRMRAARCFVLPSRSEGLPLALLEAMAAGLPVVATAVGGTPEVLTGDSGVLVPPENPEALADAVASVLMDPGVSATLGARAQARASAFSAAAATAAYEALLREVAG